ncbi:hypothetical protein M1O54_00100 [Dehalococcoidia bacterium]|nr:hypothetical protein [Dehalococcoidia bacterium]
MGGGFYIEGRRGGQDTQELTIIRNKIADLHHEVTNLQASVSAIDTRVVAIESILTSVQGEVTLIQDKVTDLQTAVSAVDTRVVTIESILTSVQGEVTLIQDKVTDLQTAVSAVDTRVVTLESTLAGIQSEVTLIHGMVTDLQAAVSAVDTKISAIESSLAAVTSHIDFWSTQVPKIVITSIAGNPGFPGISVSGLPLGVGIVRVVAMLKIRALKNTSGIDNFLKQDAAIAVMLAGGSWGVDDTPAINLVRDQWHVIGGVKESGDVMIGNNDVKGVVSGDGVYLLRGNNMAASGDNLELYDVQTGLRVYFRKP